MTSESLSTDLIERYLRARKRRYFRGQHDGEFFFVANALPRPLHVHLEISPAQADLFTIRVAPACFFPAAERARLTHCSETWNQQDPPITAVVHESSNPERIGVAAIKSQRIENGVHFEDFGSFVDRTIAAAIEFFAELTAAAELPIKTAAA